MEQNTDADARTDSMKINMAETFKEFEAVYRNDPEHREVVFEDGDCVIIADHTGHEITNGLTCLMRTATNFVKRSAHLPTKR